MKFLFSVIALFVAAISLTTTEAAAQAQTPMTPEATVHSFYEWYVHTLNQNEEPIEKHQAELGKFVTQRLIKSLNRVLKSPEGLDADFFLDAQDWDKDWEKNITTTKALIQGPRANLIVTLKGGPGFGNHKLRVGLRKEGGAWKIDSINGRRNP
jgi:Protein of unknown function (DUF3828)